MKKKINKTRKITENDVRNLHYIHENEGLIPNGVTELKDEDITSAEVITENKKSKVNESYSEFVDWAREHDKENKAAFIKVGGLDADEIERYLSYSSLYDELDLTSKEDTLLAIEKATNNREFQDIPYLIIHYLNEFGSDWTFVDLADKYENVNESKVNEDENIEGRIPDSEIHGNPSIDIGSGNVIIFDIEADYILKMDKNTIFNDALKSYEKLSGISVNSVDDYVFGDDQLYDFIIEILTNNNHTDELMKDIKPLIATYYLKYGYNESYEILCMEADYGIRGFRKIVSTFESDATYNIDFLADKKNPDLKDKVNESVGEQYFIEEYLDDFEQGYVSISYKKVLAYKKKRDEMSDDEYQKLNKQYEDLEEKMSDLDDRVDSGELTQDEAYELGDKLAKKMIKLYRKMSGGINPEWYEEEDREIDPDLTAKEKEEGVDIEKIKEEGDKESPSPKEFTEKDYEKFCKSHRVSLPYEKVKLYKEQSRSFTKKQIEYEEEKSLDISREKIDLNEKLKKGEVTQEEYDEKLQDIRRRWLKNYRVINGGADPRWYDPDTMQDIDPDLTGNWEKEEASDEAIDKFTEKKYEEFYKKYRVSLPYKIFRKYQEKYRSFTPVQQNKAHNKELDLYYEKEDLEKKLEKGEITQEEYDKVMPGVLKKHLKAYRVSNGGADPEWYNPDTMKDIDPDLNGGVNESEVTYNIDFWADKKNPNDTKEEANNILRMLGYPIDPSQSDLEEIIKHFDVDYNGDSDYEEYIVTLLGYYYLMFGSTEFYDNYVGKYGVVINESSVETSNQYWEFVQKFKESVGEDSEIYKELMTQLQSIKNYDVHAAYNLTKEFLENKGLWDEYSSDFEAIPVNEDDMDEFRKLIDSDVWKKFKEDWKGTDVYDAAMDAISYVDTLPQMIKGLKRVFDVYDMLVDYEAGLDKLLSSSVNEDNPSALTQLTDSDVWKKFKQDQGENSEVYRAAMGAMHNVMSNSYGYHDLSELIAAVKRVLAVCNVLSAYEEDLDKLLSTSVNEYKTVGVYKPNDGEVEDLYYIQAGDIILIHHKDYGELQCKVKKVDADKNKVYFVTIERGIMGVCGFDKIHGIQLVEECQKQPMFIQTKHIKFPEGGMCYMCYAKIGNRFVDVYCTFGMSLDNCECIKLLNMSEDEFGIIDNIMADSDTFEDAKNRVYNSGLVSL